MLIFVGIIGGFLYTSQEPFAISNLKQASAGDDARKNSLVRIFCDNGDRYKLVPDEYIENVVNNSRRAVDKQEWFDDVNKVTHLGGSKCQPEWEANMVAFQWPGKNKYDHDQKDGDERKYRTTITVRKQFALVPFFID